MESIDVNVWDTLLPSISIQICSSKRASSICAEVAAKINLPSSELDFFSLILVHVQLNELTSGNSYFLRTLNGNDIAVDIRDNIVATHLQSSENDGKIYCAYQFDSTNPIPNRAWDCKWYFKDIRSCPISFDDSGDISGASSDDEEELSPQDFSYLKMGERRGYMFKRSGSDPNLWKRRLCVLTDKFWCIDMKKTIPRAFCLSLNSDILLQDTTPSYDLPFALVIHAPHRVHYFRANSSQDQQNWLSEIFYRVFLSRENDVISIAETIIGDEETAQARLLQTCVTKCMASSSSVMAHVLHQLDDDRCARDVIVFGGGTRAGAGITVTGVTGGTTDVWNNKGKGCTKYLPSFSHRHYPRRNQVHLLHQQHSPLGLFLSLSLDVQRFKIDQRDEAISVRELWLRLMHLFRTALLPLHHHSFFSSVWCHANNTSNTTDSSTTSGTRDRDVDLFVEMLLTVYSNVRRSTAPPLTALFPRRHDESIKVTMDENDGDLSVAVSTAMASLFSWGSVSFAETVTLSVTAALWSGEVLSDNSTTGAADSAIIRSRPDQALQLTVEEIETCGDNLLDACCALCEADSSSSSSSWLGFEFVDLSVRPMANLFDELILLLQRALDEENSTTSNAKAISESGECKTEVLIEKDDHDDIDEWSFASFPDISLSNSSIDVTVRDVNMGYLHNHSSAEFEKYQGDLD